MTVRVGYQRLRPYRPQLLPRRCSPRAPDIEVVAFNDLFDDDTQAHLLKYDSILGPAGPCQLRSSRAASRSGTDLSSPTPSAIRPRLPWGDDRRGRRHRVHRLLHRCHARRRHTSTRAPRR